jgi:hypothetical protein
MSEKKFTFKECKTESEINDIYNFNVQAFADSHDFAWTADNIKNELENGWILYALKSNKDVICALFVKREKNILLTKNTPIKMNYQGQGHSHSIKEFYENIAKESGVKELYNYSPVDNFRMISLNEGHGYKKTGKTLTGNQELIEWVKPI